MVKMIKVLKRKSFGDLVKNGKNLKKSTFWSIWSKMVKWHIRNTTQNLAKKNGQKWILSTKSQHFGQNGRNGQKWYFWHLDTLKSSYISVMVKSVFWTLIVNLSEKGVKTGISALKWSILVKMVKTVKMVKNSIFDT